MKTEIKGLLYNFLVLGGIFALGTLLTYGDKMVGLIAALIIAPALKWRRMERRRQ